MAKAVCGECMQPEDRHLNHCSSNPRSAPRSERSTSLDDAKWQAKKQRDRDRYDKIQEAPHKRANKTRWWHI